MAIVTPIKTESGRRRRLRLSSPATLETIGEIECATADDVKAAVEKARKAQPGWAALSFEQRGQYLLRALKILLDRQDDFINVILQEGPKPRMDAVQMDIFCCCDVLDYYAKNTANFLQTQKVDLHGLLAMTKDLYVMYKPLGVVGVITPWNGPFVLSLLHVVQALMASNAVILKPSEVSPMSGKAAGDLLHEAGVPQDVLVVLLGDGETGQLLVESDVQKISFTGSVEVGKKVATMCAERLLPYTLELGGKDPMIVCADANLDMAAGGAVTGCFINTGQVCCGTERVYVIESIAEEFLQKAVERTSKLRQAIDGEFDVGPLFSAEQLQIVEEHVADAVAKGAKVLVGGRRNPNLKGLYYEPTVLVDVTHDMLIMREETFGPTMPIMKVKDEDEAIRMANDTHYGLGANVWTNDIDKGIEMAKRITAGSVSINDMTVTFGIPEAPFGGVRDSGVGRVNGELGLKSYCSIQPVTVDKMGGMQTATMYPTSVQAAIDMQNLYRSFWGAQFI